LIVHIISTDEDKNFMNEINHLDFTF